MTTKDLLIFTAVGTTLILGVTFIGWIYFLKWAKAEKKQREERFGKKE